jgi:hypothetical protein
MPLQGDGEEIIQKVKFDKKMNEVIIRKCV